MRKSILFMLFFCSLTPIYAEQNPDNPDSQLKPFYDFGASLHLVAFFPLGYYADCYTPGYGVNAKVQWNPKLINYLFFNLESGFITGRLTSNNQYNYYFLPECLTVEYRYHIFNEFFVYANLGGGFYIMQLPQNLNNEYLFIHDLYKAELGFLYNITNYLTVGIMANFYLLNDPYKPMQAFSAGINFQYNFGDAPEDKDIAIEDIALKPVFPAIYETYVNDPIGTIVIKNKSDSLLEDIKIYVTIPGFSARSLCKQILPTMISKQEATIRLTAIFNSNILYNILISLPVKIEIEYILNKIRKRKIAMKNISFYSKNDILWDNPLKLGSFISQKDSAILDFSRKILAAQSNQNPLLSVNLVNTVKIFEGLRLYGLNYVKNQVTRYDGTYLKVDFFQYPRETLQRKSGDCKDFSALFAAMYESIGINTAFVLLPDHVFLLIETDVLEYNTVKYNNKTWIPLETTLLDKGFYTAAEQGYKTFNNTSVKTIILTSVAIENYKPVPFSENIDIAFNFNSIVIDQEILKLTTLMEDKLDKEEEKDLDKLSALELSIKGSKLVRSGSLKKPERYLKKAIEKEATYEVPYYNLILFYLKHNFYDKAQELYKVYLKQIPNGILKDKIKKLIKNLK